jgi:hypothetical protein
MPEVQGYEYKTFAKFSSAAIEDSLNEEPEMSLIINLEKISFTLFLSQRKIKYAVRVKRACKLRVYNNTYC